MTDTYVLYDITYDGAASGDNLPPWLEMENSEELTGQNLVDAFSDYITAETGYCHEGFSVGLVLDTEQMEAEDQPEDARPIPFDKWDTDPKTVSLRSTLADMSTKANAATKAVSDLRKRLAELEQELAELTGK